MGLGKTRQAILACDAVGAANVLVLCPAIARLNWLEEFERFSSRSRSGAALLSAAGLTTIAGKSLITCSYDLATRSAVQSALASRTWQAVICDEAHYLKSPKAARTRAAVALCRAAERAWWLSGTPAPNHGGELYVPCKMAGAWSGNRLDFEQRYTTGYHSDYGWRVTGNARTQELRQAIAPWMKRRTKLEVNLQLPPLTLGDVYVTPEEVPDAVWTTYYPHRSKEALDAALSHQQQRIDAVLRRQDGILSERMIPALDHLAPQISVWRTMTGLSKVDGIVRLVADEMDSKAYDRLVIFAVHRGVIDELFLRFNERKLRAQYIMGGTSPIVRDNLIKGFQAGQFPILICQIVAAGTAVSLTAASQVLVAEADWTPANNQQAIMRCHRIGQTQPVNVRFVMSDDKKSLDYMVQRALRRKAQNLLSIFD